MDRENAHLPGNAPRDVARADRDRAAMSEGIRALRREHRRARHRHHRRVEARRGRLSAGRHWPVLDGEEGGDEGAFGPIEQARRKTVVLAQHQPFEVALGHDLDMRERPPLEFGEEPALEARHGRLARAPGDAEAAD